MSGDKKRSSPGTEGMLTLVGESGKVWPDRCDQRRRFRMRIIVVPIVISAASRDQSTPLQPQQILEKNPRGPLVPSRADVRGRPGCGESGFVAEPSLIAAIGAPNQRVKAVQFARPDQAAASLLRGNVLAVNQGLAGASNSDGGETLIEALAAAIATELKIAGRCGKITPGTNLPELRVVHLDRRTVVPRLAVEGCRGEHIRGAYPPTDPGLNHLMGRIGLSIHRAAPFGRNQNITGGTVDGSAVVEDPRSHFPGVRRGKIAAFFPST